MRELEEKLNKVFSVYAKAYYSNTTISSCYVWELGDKIEDGIALAVLFKNNISFQKEVESGTWDSCNFITINFSKNAEGLKAVYKLITTVFLQMNFNHKVCGKCYLSGSVNKQVTNL